MSVQAMTWALYEAPGIDPTARLVLAVLADHAHMDGTAAFPSKQTIADVVGIAPGNVRAHLRKLEAQGLIRKGNQLHVEYIRKDKRPTVYDLAMSDGQRVANIAKNIHQNKLPGTNPRGGTPATPRKSVDKTVNKSSETVDKTVDENVDNFERGYAQGPSGGTHGGMPAYPKPLTQKITHGGGGDYENWATCHQCDVAKPDDQMTTGGVCRDCVMHGPSTAGSPGKAALDAMRAELKAKREAKEQRERAEQATLQAKLKERRAGLNASRPTDTVPTQKMAYDGETYRGGSHVQPAGVWGP
ncbi:helix-turn-helix domain-containing protein [Glutamicibacter sp. NPDC087673]|uniref:helix-turn-helix domain-containing protein n=1 Tax=Glutamicibacter sp. NPDC087673 TaxID=3363997 RepID=UPI003806B10F